MRPGERIGKILDTHGFFPTHELCLLWFDPGLTPILAPGDCLGLSRLDQTSERPSVGPKQEERKRADHQSQRQPWGLKEEMKQ